MGKLHGKMMIVIVEYRLSTIHRADRIFWIEDGTCTHAGTHSDLLVSCSSISEEKHGKRDVRTWKVYGSRNITSI